MIQITEPIAIAAFIPSISVFPDALITIVAIRRVAIAIPDTGLLEDPIRPTIREDTVAKKKPNIIMIIAATMLIGTDGIATSASATKTTTTIAHLIGRSFSVRRSPPLCPIPPSAFLNVLIIRGSDLIG